MVEPHLEAVFPALRGQAYGITSPKDRRYNCIAWVVGDTRNWWWPDAAGDDFWPVNAPRAETLAAFEAAFATVGFTVCDHDQPEPGYEKIAVFALNSVPKHAARQLPSGRCLCPRQVGR